MKTFFRTEGIESAGNCVMCHTPPLFSDLSFHNMGISQSEYDQVNGEGSFAELEIPAASAARRPSPQFRETPSRQKPGCADLGFWNFVDVKATEFRRAGETDDRFLRRMIGAFKTPTLRNLSFSQPYMHTGGFTTVESALAELMRLSEMARAGKVREGDEELSRIRITEADIAGLVAFLSTLNENMTNRKY
jgi:cytochrome c peroxidase